MIQHIWQGKIIDNKDLEERMAGLSDEISETLGETLSTADVLDACEMLSQALRNNAYPELTEALRVDGVPNPQEVLLNLANFLTRPALEKKLLAELGTSDPFLIHRVSYDEAHYETWSPMGVLVHITAGNSPVVAPMAAVEGLLSGNINIIKVASNMGAFSAQFLRILGRYANIGKFIYMLRISSQQTCIMQEVIDMADCVSAWGGEEAIKAIREMTPQGIPVVAWGHKISFAYITPDCINPQTVDDLVHSICRNEQQSCSSPQCALIDTDDPAEVRRFGKLLAEGLERVRATYPLQAPDMAQAAEITAVTQLYRTELCFEKGEVIEAEDYLYRILISDAPKFMPSPLYRTIWLSPLPHQKLVGTLRSMRQYLQTAGLACEMKDVNTLTQLLYRAGLTRVAPIRSMSASYTGEPHDGIFALPRFVKRVSFRTDLPMHGINTFMELDSYNRPSFVGEPIQHKIDYPPIPEAGTRILMKSGGTTGEPVYCSYTQNDYMHYIVKCGAPALLAAGLDPKVDITADLLKGGNLYGGMNCFISIFDELKAPHLSIGGLDDYKLVAKYIIKGKANALLGAPSYIIRLLKENEALFKSYGRLNKIFYGGESISKGQVEYLKETFGITAIHSMLYGSNETGTMGYSCEYCENGVFHLNTEIQQLEILKMDEDEPVAGEETGRLIFTGFKRENGKTKRYEIGDMGHWIDGDCPCGRKQPLFRLSGRYGDVIRIGGTFFNYRKIVMILSESMNYSGRLQLIIEKDAYQDIMTFCMENVTLTEEELVGHLLNSGYDSFHKTLPAKLVRVRLKIIKPEEFLMNETSMKLREIIYQ